MTEPDTRPWGCRSETPIASSRPMDSQSTSGRRSGRPASRNSRRGLPSRGLRATGDQAASQAERHSVENRRPYRLAYDVIKRQILGNSLPVGLVLLESRVAEMLAMSRAPVRRALDLLHKDGLIHRFDGRGYLISPESGATGKIAPLRINLREAGFRTPEGLSESIGLFTWERIYREVESAVGRSIPFGTYKIVESAITKRFQVSRTVAREVLGRLRDRGVIEKNRWSTWIAGPLTARAVDEYFDLRILLEPHALRSSPAARDRVAVERLRQDLLAAIATPQAPSLAVERIQREFDLILLRSNWNSRLLNVVEECRMPMVINQLFEQHFGPTDDRPALQEQLLTVEQLCHGAIEAAAAALAAHLESTRRRTKARLKVLAVVPDPETESYLERIH